MAGPGAPAGGGEQPAAYDRFLDQGIGDLALATEQYFLRLIDFLDCRILILGGPEAEGSAPLLSAKGAAELGLRASKRLAETIAQSRK